MELSPKVLPLEGLAGLDLEIYAKLRLKSKWKFAKELSGDVVDGDLASMPAYIIERRKESFSHFYRGDKGRSSQYCNWDIPLIASRFLDLWEGVEIKFSEEDTTIRRRCFLPEHLDTIEHDF